MDIQWCAGLFLADGCTAIYQQTPRSDRIYHRVYLAVKMRDRECVEIFHDTLNLSLPVRGYYDHDKPYKMWQAEVNSAGEVKSVLNALKPFIRGEKKREAELVEAMCDSIIRYKGLRPTKRGGRTLSDDELRLRQTLYREYRKYIEQLRAGATTERVDPKGKRQSELAGDSKKAS